MKRCFVLTVCMLLSFLHLNSSPKKRYSENTGTLKISFVNTVKGEPVALNSGKYSNAFGEEYSISKLKYYISQVAVLKAGSAFAEPESYHLVDESNTSALHFNVNLEAGNYDAIRFLLGVDSLHNVSGAQSGALDPLNDMFWTWNTGYVMAKLEGHSVQAPTVNNKFEFHIGGFFGENNVLENITLNFPPEKIIAIQPGLTSEIIIEADIDTWWQQPADIKISAHPVCSSPGPLAKRIAGNYRKMFSIKNIVNNTN